MTYDVPAMTHDASSLACAETTPSLARAEMFKWARQVCGIRIDVVAQKLAIEACQVTVWEAGKGAPTIPQLRQMADIYQRPLAFFYLPRPPKNPKRLLSIIASRRRPK